MLAPEYANWSRLAFQSARNEHDWEVYAACGDGSDQVNLSSHAKTDISPRLNRGATRIVFASNRYGKYEILTMNADGSGPTRVTNNSTDDVLPAWSPDGTRIVFQSYRDKQAEIYVMNADGSGQTRLTNYSDYDGQPAWSPDGTRIAFTRWSSDQHRIWVMNADGSNPRQLSNQNYSENPAWSPDGSQIAYDSDGNGNGWQEIWLMDAAGGNQRQVYQPSEGNTDAWVRSWSPDSRYVAFTRISWIQQSGNWYWTTAYLDAWDTVSTWNAMRLSSTGMDMYPDWQSTDLQAPTSSMQPLPAQSPGPFTVKWSARMLARPAWLSYRRPGQGGRGRRVDRLVMATTADRNPTRAPADTPTTSGACQGQCRQSGVLATGLRCVHNRRIHAASHYARSRACLHSGDTVTIQWEGHDPGGSGFWNYLGDVHDLATGEYVTGWATWMSPGQTETSQTRELVLNPAAPTASRFAAIDWKRTRNPGARYGQRCTVGRSADPRETSETLRSRSRHYDVSSSYERRHQ